MKSLIAVLLLICMACSCSDSKPGKEAYLAWKKVEAKANANAYLGYQKAYKVAVYELDKFIKTSDKKLQDIDDGSLKTSFIIANHTVRKFDMLKIKERYLLAGYLWRDRYETMKPFISDDSEIYIMIDKSFPKLIQEVKAKQNDYGSTLNSDELRKLLWRDASLKLNEISKMYE